MTSATDAGHRGYERGSTPAGLAQSNYVQFANGINGDEDLGQNIIMKDKQLHKIKIKNNWKEAADDHAHTSNLDFDPIRRLRDKRRLLLQGLKVTWD